ncbi:HlyD family secretion protein [Agitococcus lubricus]|uniref:Membrane fusion protein (Multidrug efflux system) n=1 Tax=Agitococcus lubricus TaxID=1077255 RepID=A0A2T5IYH7_9GAMM|nr:HlyD family secretion protein [Agitococcus lubricus]PTQ89046.1 membrane fusion protein (multidrug efflux system) [Agitococcus lubricus]
MSQPSTNKLPFVIVGLLLILGIGLGTYWAMYGRYQESTDNAYIKAETTFITPRVGGEVVELLVKNNQRVRAGEVLLRLENTDYKAKVENARALLAMKQAALGINYQQNQMQKALTQEAQANLRAAKTEVTRLALELERAKTLVAEGVATKQRLDNANAAYQSALANAERSQAAIIAAQAQQAAVGTGREQALAEIEAAKASLALAELDLAATEIKAPIAGVVGDLGARLGSRVAVGSRLLAIVPVADVFVEANFKETQLTHMQVGQRAQISVDAYQDKIFTGHVDSIAPASGAEFALLPPDNATGNFNKIVQRLSVKILLDQPNDGLLLKSGMSAQVTVSLK